MIPRRPGKVINVASILGLIGSNDSDRPGTIAYNTSKGGVISFTRSLAAEADFDRLEIQPRQIRAALHSYSIEQRRQSGRCFEHADWKRSEVIALTAR